MCVFRCLYYVPFACCLFSALCFFFFNDTPPTEIYTLSLHDALPIFNQQPVRTDVQQPSADRLTAVHSLNSDDRSEEHTSELQSLRHLVCRLLLEKKKKKITKSQK